MKGIRNILLVLSGLIFMTCSEDDQIVFDAANGQFVRFHLQVDNNNQVIEAPGIDNATPAVSNYTKDNFKTLKIPVALTATNIQGNVTVDFATEMTNIQNVSIEPSSSLTFTNTTLVDTIFVNFNERWDAATSPELKFTLTSTSDASINLGMPNTAVPNDELTINFAELDFSYQLQSPNMEEIVGTIGEEVTIDIIFPDGYVTAEIESLELLEEEASSFGYTLTQNPLTDPTKITYTCTVTENIAVDELQYQTLFTLIDIPEYTLVGSDTFTITKPIVIPRDNSVNTANNFYDLSNPFYRTYGENWLDANSDDVCAWSSFFAFTFPVIVDADHPNAVLFNDMGTADPSDDIYHHAFRIGFDATLPNRTTNSFNLKRWFNNEATNEENSPGFNIPEALEFFPTNGTSQTDGFVQVIEQDLLISGTNGNSYILRISGEGTYQQIAGDLYEITLTLQVQNDALFGGTVVAEYKIYSNNSYTDPADLNESCFPPIDL
ncbi:MAG: hypothetical protein AAF611_17995 [Bacteroidota bacterium]